MATKRKTRTRTITRYRTRPAAPIARRRSSGPRKNYKKAALTRARSASSAKSKMKTRALTVGVGLGLGVLDRKGIEIPGIGGMGNALTTAAAALGLSLVAKGKNKDMLVDVAAAAGVLAAYEFGEDSDALDFLD